MVTRRKFLISGALLGAGLFLPKVPAPAAKAAATAVDGGAPAAAVPPAAPLKAARLAHGSHSTGRGSSLPGGTLDPSAVNKYAEALVVPPAMPRASVKTGPHGEEVDYYEIAMRQFDQQILPSSQYPKTTVWSYGSAVESHGSTFNFPSFTIEAQAHRPVRVRWINGLVDANGAFLPHLLPIDQTLHWANPPGGMHHRDHRGTDTSPYQGPVPIVTHVHGAHTHEDSDGYPEAWFLPAANNIPAEYATEGTFFDEFKAKAEARQGEPWAAGSAVFDYPNDQRAATLWYHDHSLGMTRSNVYAGPAGFYLVRGGPDDLQDGSLPEGEFEIPLAVQDRSFNADASLFYPSSREFFDGFTGPYIGQGNSDISPIWNPEFFGNMMLVNGRTWPKFTVQRRRYRFRFLNGCNSRFIILKLTDDDPASPGFQYPAAGALPIWQIGAEGGFLDAPVSTDAVLMSPAERADVIIDFSQAPAEVTSLWLINEGPDEPYGGGVPGFDFARADIGSTGQVMRFDLLPGPVEDTTTAPAALVLPARRKLGAAVKTRRVALMEMDSETVFINAIEPFGPREAMLGVVKSNIYGNPIFEEKMWMNEVTETPVAGDTEIWEIYNTTMDAHPIHVHQVMFEVLNREDRMMGEIFDPEPTEHGYKDTVIAYPDQITRIKARFDLPGLFVWHCHIVEHEDNEMMRPYRVLYRQDMPLVTQ